MAEVFGVAASAISLASLFQLCLQAFDMIQVSRRQEADLHKLKLRLNIEKCRLYTWGEAMGLTTNPPEGELPPLYSCRFQTVVQDTLNVLLSLFTETHKITNRYGCNQDPFYDGNSPPVSPLSTEYTALDDLSLPFAGFSVQTPLPRPGSAGGRKMQQRIRWVIQDREKFAALIAEVKDLIDGLQEITKFLSPPAFQASVLRDRAQQITDPRTLLLVSEACELHHPDVSDAASMKLELMSVATTKKRHIEVWAAESRSQDWQPDYFDPLDLESLDITELKHKLRSIQTSVTQRMMIDKEIKSLGRYGRNGVRFFDYSTAQNVIEVLDQQIFNELTTPPALSRSSTRQSSFS